MLAVRSAGPADMYGVAMLALRTMLSLPSERDLVFLIYFSATIMTQPVVKMQAKEWLTDRD